MSSYTLFVGLDVHAKSINVAVAEAGRSGEVRSLGTIPNRRDSIRKKIRKLQKQYGRITVCYEAGPCGYQIYWLLLEINIDCVVIAPSLIPKKPGDKVKTDRIDAITLARCHRSGDLTEVWVPSKEIEALRDLVRARRAIRDDLRGARHRLSKFILKSEHQKPDKMKNWTQAHMRWIKALDFDFAASDYVYQDYLAEVEYQADRLKRVEAQIDKVIETSPEETREVVVALQTLRGVAKITAVGLVAEIGNFSRFPNPAQLMKYIGVTPSEYTTGGPGKRRTGAITRMGNTHARCLVTESGWNYRFQPSVNGRMKKAAEQLAPELVPEIKRISWKAQQRLCGRYRALLARGKTKQTTVTAVGRELLGFVWDIATHVEQMHAA